MSLLLIIGFILVVGCLFPGGEVLIFAVLWIVGLGLALAYWGYSMVGLLWLFRWLGWDDGDLGAVCLIFSMFAPIVIPMIIGSVVDVVRAHQRAAPQPKDK